MLVRAIPQPDINVQFGQKVLLAQLAVALVCVDPDGTDQVLANELNLTPVLPAFHVALVCRACAEGDGETDDETKDGEQQVADVEWLEKC